MTRERYTDEDGNPCIRITADTEAEKQILKDLVGSKVEWLEVDLEKGYIDVDGS